MDLNTKVEYMKMLNDDLRDEIMSDLDVLNNKMRLLNILDSLKNKLMSGSLTKSEVQQIVIQYHLVMNNLRKVSESLESSEEFSL